MDLKVNDVSVSFRKKKVLSNICFSVSPGIYGIVGENGAGKTTLFRSILGLQTYSGTIEKNGIFHVGYVPQKFDSLPGLSLEDTLQYFGCLQGIPKNERKSMAEALLEKVNLSEEKNKKVRELSGGMLRRLGIAQALIGDPQLLIMDEPTVGLDPAERIRFRNILKKIREERIILISSHEIKELEHFCDLFIFLHQGRIAAMDSAKHLQEHFGISDMEEIYFNVIGGMLHGEGETPAASDLGMADKKS